MTKPSRSIAVVAASCAAFLLVTLFFIQVRFIAGTLNLLPLPHATAEAAENPLANSGNGSTVQAEYCSEAIAANNFGNPTGRTSTSLTLNDAWFDANPHSYNHALATSCAVLSAVCNSESRFYSSDGAEYPYAERALGALGFSHVRTESYALRSTVVDQVGALMNGTHNSAAYTFASKPLNAANADTLVFVGVRGTYGAEWVSNFSFLDPSGEDVDHAGYRTAEQEVVTALQAYLRDIGANPAHTRILITGHSRGGAIANLLAAELIDRADTPLALAPADGVYAYTFAAPGSTRADARDATAYKGIFNVVNPADLVPQLPLAAWGYGRYGTTVELPSATDERFAGSFATMQQVYLENTGRLDTCSTDTLASLDSFEERAAQSLPTADSFLCPLGIVAAAGELAQIDWNQALVAHYPDTYIAWMQALDPAALSFVYTV